MKKLYELTYTRKKIYTDYPVIIKLYVYAKNSKDAVSFCLGYINTSVYFKPKCERVY